VSDAADDSLTTYANGGYVDESETAGAYTDGQGDAGVYEDTTVSWADGQGDSGVYDESAEATCQDGQVTYASETYSEVDQGGEVPCGEGACDETYEEDDTCEIDDDYDVDYDC
jgi:hypothetical protein